LRSASDFNWLIIRENQPRSVISAAIKRVCDKPVADRARSFGQVRRRSAVSALQLFHTYVVAASVCTVEVRGDGSRAKQKQHS
jgi:hypothetical protein